MYTCVKVTTNLIMYTGRRDSCERKCHVVCLLMFVYCPQVCQCVCSKLGTLTLSLLESVVAEARVQEFTEPRNYTYTNRTKIATQWSVSACVQPGTRKLGDHAVPDSVAKTPMRLNWNYRGYYWPDNTLEAQFVCQCFCVPGQYLQY